MKKQIAELMNKEMDRKNFLQYGVGVVLAVVGFSSLVKILIPGEDKQSSYGYGSSPYGK